MGRAEHGGSGRTRTGLGGRAGRRGSGGAAGGRGGRTASRSQRPPSSALPVHASRVPIGCPPMATTTDARTTSVDPSEDQPDPRGPAGPSALQRRPPGIDVGRLAGTAGGTAKGASGHPVRTSAAAAADRRLPPAVHRARASGDDRPPRTAPSDGWTAGAGGGLRRVPSWPPKNSEWREGRPASSLIRVTGGGPQERTSSVAPISAGRLARGPRQGGRARAQHAFVATKRSFWCQSEQSRRRPTPAFGARQGL